MVELIFESPNGTSSYLVDDGLAGILAGRRRLRPGRAADAKQWIAVGDRSHLPHSSDVILTLRRTDPYDASSLTDLSDKLGPVGGITIRINGDDIYHAGVRNISWRIMERPAYPWVRLAISIATVTPRYVAGVSLQANGSIVTANNAVVYVNGKEL